MATQVEIDRGPGFGAVIDAFGYAPNHASRIHGLGGSKPSADGAYVFCTVPVRSMPGPITFTIQFNDLQATCGTLVLQIFAVSAIPGVEATPSTATVISMADLARSGGLHHIETVGRRNMLYAVAGHIYDETDATAIGVTISLDQGLAPDPWEPRSIGPATGTRAPGVSAGGLHRAARLVSLAPPNLDNPVSQGWTAEQCRQRPFAEWMEVLHQPAQSTRINWAAAYILQSLRSFGALQSGAAGLGFGVLEQSLPAILAARGCSVLATAPHHDAAPDGDPALALEQRCRPDLCQRDRFFENVRFATVDSAAIPQTLRDFDFLWSAGMGDEAGTTEKFQHFVESSMHCLKPGGLAVHVFQWAPAGGRRLHRGFVYDRPAIERIALSLISRGHEVAQLKFQYDARTSSKDGDAVPFGLIARRP